MGDVINNSATLPAEVSTREAARIAGVDQKTVKKYHERGGGSVAQFAPLSQRGTFRIELDCCWLFACPTRRHGLRHRPKKSGAAP